MSNRSIAQASNAAKTPTRAEVEAAIKNLKWVWRRNQHGHPEQFPADERQFNAVIVPWIAEQQARWSNDDAFTIAVLKFLRDNGNLIGYLADCVRDFETTDALTAAQFATIRKSALGNLLLSYTSQAAVKANKPLSDEPMLGYSARLAIEVSADDVAKVLAKANKKARKIAGGLEKLAKQTGKPVFTYQDGDPEALIKACLHLVIERNKVSRTLFLIGDAAVKLTVNPVTGRAHTEPLTWKTMRREIGAVTLITLVNVAGNTRTISAPQDICEGALTDIAAKLPQLSRITEIPFVSDGKIITTPGYDAASGVYYAPPKSLVIEQPADMDAAKAVLWDVFGEFPFVGGTYAHVVAACLQPIVRDMIAGGCPSYMIRKPASGTGATLLTEVVCRIVTGEAAPSEPKPTSDREWHLNLTSTLMSGASLLVIDNLGENETLKSQALENFLTAEVFTGRALHTNAKPKLPNRILTILTANNPKTTKALINRMVFVGLDRNTDDPEAKNDYKHADLKSHALAVRGKVVGALVFMVQSWLDAGRPMPATKHFHPRYPEYASIVGAVLDHADIHGFLDDKQFREKALDDEEDALPPFIKLMHATFGNKPTAVGSLEWNEPDSATPPADLVHLLLKHRDDFDGIWFVGKEPKDKWGNRLGRALSPEVDKVFAVGDGMKVKLVKERLTGGAKAYRLEPVAAVAPE